MGKIEYFIKRVYEIISELGQPLINERVYDKIFFNSEKAIITITFKFEEDESVIRGFIGLAKYFHSVIIKRKNRFYMPYNHLLFVLTSP
ncbi:MAG: hypothetical protein ACFFDN_33080 [Candidatus Hodarchaeota archaeon]